MNFGMNDKVKVIKARIPSKEKYIGNTYEINYVDKDKNAPCPYGFKGIRGRVFSDEELELVEKYEPVSSLSEYHIDEILAEVRLRTKQYNEY